MFEAMQVLRTRCPFWERTVYELWDGCQPVIPANNYLRSNLALGDNTLADKAYSLLLFFRFLKRNSLHFFDLSPSSMTPLVLLFRNDLLFRARGGNDDAGLIKSSRPNRSVPTRTFGYARARSVLLEVGWLCEWWGLVKPRHSLTSFRRARRSGFRTQWNNLPDCFQIGVPKTKKKFCENHALEIAEIENIWNYVTSEARPSQPTILAKHPTGPKRGWLLSGPPLGEPHNRVTNDDSHGFIDNRCSGPCYSVLQCVSVKSPFCSWLMFSSMAKIYGSACA